MNSSLASLIPPNLKAIIFDFDGVFTDNRVLVLEDGREAVFCSRGDGLAFEIFRQQCPQIQLQVISKEANPVVQSRCRKLKLDCLHGVDDKLTLLKQWSAQRDIPLCEMIFLGNDLNDLECIRAVGCGVAVADAFPPVKAAAKLVLERAGGQGAIRELLELVQNSLPKEA